MCATRRSRALIRYAWHSDTLICAACTVYKVFGREQYCLCCRLWARGHSSSLSLDSTIVYYCPIYCTIPRAPTCVLVPRSCAGKRFHCSREHLFAKPYAAARLAPPRAPPAATRRACLCLCLCPACCSLSLSSWANLPTTRTSPVSSCGLWSYSYRCGCRIAQSRATSARRRASTPATSRSLLL